MGKTKKKLPAMVVTEACRSNTGDDPPPKRKRGRPRKITQEAVKAEEQDAGIESKKLKAASGDAPEDGQKESSPAVAQKTQGADVKVSSDDGPPNPKPAIRREGSRRKSEPRRAAESSLVGR